ncbi:MAG: cell wall-binding repeat-containing protein [Solirubrobacterales bacterium]
MTRPINADVPVAEPEATEPTKSPASSPPTPSKRRRKSIPTALKAIAALFVLAVVFIVAAIVGGKGEGTKRPEAPAPVSEAPGAPAEAPAARAPEELGYPAFATANTTRVGGADPAANAAGVALATYPSTKPSQQPDAVVLVDSEDWRGAIAASVLVAAPVGAPVLVAEADGTPEPTEQALAALDPQGSKTTKGAQAFVIGAASAPSGLRARRVGGAGATVAAAAIAKLRDDLHGGAPRHIVVAPSSQPAFAMPAAAWAARSGDPVLYADEDELPAPTAAVLRRHSKTPVYVLGPSSAISSDVLRQIGAISDQVRRVSGEDPVANAIALARYADGNFGWNVNDPGHGFVVARSEDPLDAAAAAPLSASGTWGPLLLTDSADTLPAALRGYLLDVKPGYTTDPTRAFYNHVWVIGDQEAIDVNQQAEIDELAELAKIGGGE